MLESNTQTKIDCELTSIWNTILGNCSATKQDLFMVTRHLWLSWCLRLDFNPNTADISLTSPTEEFILIYTKLNKGKTMLIERNDGFQDHYYEIHQLIKPTERYKAYSNDTNNMTKKSRLRAGERYNLAMRLRQAHLHSLSLFNECEIESYIVTNEAKKQQLLDNALYKRGFELIPFDRKSHEVTLPSYFCRN